MAFYCEFPVVVDVNKLLVNFMLETVSKRMPVHHVRLNKALQSSPESVLFTIHQFLVSQTSLTFHELKLPVALGARL